MTIRDAIRYVEATFPLVDESTKLKLIEAYLEGAIDAIRTARKERR